MPTTTHQAIAAAVDALRHARIQAVLHEDERLKLALRPLQAACAGVGHILSHEGCAPDRMMFCVVCRATVDTPTPEPAKV